MSVDRRLMINCLVLFLLIGTALFVPEFIYMRANDIDYPVHLGFFSKLIKIVSISFFVPPLFLLFNRVLSNFETIIVKVGLICLLLLVAVLLHLVLNEFLQSLVGFRPPNRSLLQLVAYASGRGLDTQLFSFLMPFFVVYGLSQLKRNPEGVIETEDVGEASGLYVKRRGEVIWMSYDEICYLESDGNYLKLYRENGKYEIIREALTILEEKLPAEFIRVHRSFIVNLNFVQGIKTGEALMMNNGTVIKISRSKYKEVSLKWRNRPSSLSANRSK